ncbi:hypothetical protein ES705_42699 [subsurface metagenome]
MLLTCISMVSSAVAPDVTSKRTIRYWVVVPTSKVSVKVHSPSIPLKLPADPNCSSPASRMVSELSHSSIFASPFSASIVPPFSFKVTAVT